MRAQLITLGCSKNRVDSEHLLKQIEAAGIEIVPSDLPLDNNNKVDCVIINTCGFINDAKEESINTILLAVSAKESGFVGAIYVFGCLSQRYKDELVVNIPEVDGFFGAFDIEGVAKAIGIEIDKGLFTKRFLTTPKHYAYLKISEGCDRGCSYCAIPLIRGKHISVPMEQLICEAKHLAEGGVKELIVVAQDTTYYGLDIYKKRMLAPLLRELSKIEGIEWIRLHYSYPAQFPDDLLEEMAANPKICKYIDIPLQHSSTKILSAMRRSVDAKETKALMEKFRAIVPNVVLRTTMIVGFPGESKREFDHLLNFVRENKFERLGAFTYSQEEGTYGALRYKDSVRASTKQRRYDALMALQSEISYEYNLSRVGSIERVIVDGIDGEYLQCRSSKESPEVDGVILVKYSSSFALKDIIGNFVDIKITEATEYDLYGEIVN